jgi:MarR family transcriptional regulator, transcriptional regulator for hemolysin
MSKVIKKSGSAIETAVLVTDVGRYYRNLIDRELEPLGVTRSQWWTLTNLYYHDGITQMELATILDIGKSSAGKLLCKLEQKGWIERIPDKQDGRANNIYLSEKIKPIVEKMVDLCIEITSTTLTGFSEKERHQLIELLMRLRKGFTEPSSQAHEKIAKLRGELKAEADLQLNQ